MTDIDAIISKSFQKLQDDMLLKSLGAVSTAMNQPSKPLTMETLQEALDAASPKPEYMFFINMNSVLGALRLLKKEGLRWKRVKDRNWIKVYSGLQFLGDLYVDPLNTFENGKIGCIKKDKMTLQFENQFKPRYEPFIDTGVLRTRYRWGE